MVPKPRRSLAPEKLAPLRNISFIAIGGRVERTNPVIAERVAARMKLYGLPPLDILAGAIGRFPAVW
jgi:hypothetical protein